MAAVSAAAQAVQPRPAFGAGGGPIPGAERAGQRAAHRAPQFDSAVPPPSEIRLRRVLRLAAAP